MSCKIQGFIKLILFSETDFYFQKNKYSVNVYSTLNLINGSKGKNIVIPALLGSSENNTRY
jgi:hypothetical protein